MSTVRRVRCDLRAALRYVAWDTCSPFNTRCTVPVPTPSFAAIARMDSPFAFSRSILVTILSSVRGAPRRTPLALALASPAFTRSRAGRPVSCRQVDYDRKNNRPVHQCYAADNDLQEQMVLAGWAWAYTQYSDRYVPEEKDAMAGKVGVHAHRCQPPWEWRAAPLVLTRQHCWQKVDSSLTASGL
jgi:hypothetical protein